MSHNEYGIKKHGKCFNCQEKKGNIPPSLTLRSALACYLPHPLCTSEIYSPPVALNENKWLPGTLWIQYKSCFIDDSKKLQMWLVYLSYSMTRAFHLLCLLIHIMWLLGILQEKGGVSCLTDIYWGNKYRWIKVKMSVTCKIYILSTGKWKIIIK